MMLCSIKKSVVLLILGSVFSLAEALFTPDSLALPTPSDSITDIATTLVTESEFSGNALVDAITADSLISENPEEDEVQDSLEETAEELVENATEEENVEEVALADSTVQDSVQQLLLDMTTAYIPTESRRISSPYGLRTYRMHRGVDLGLCHGENRTIRAAFAGKVVKVRNQGRRKGFGRYVVIDHGNGLTTLYAHLHSWSVKVGDEVMAGDSIGVGGNTGRSFGAHLHFEVRFNGIFVDPAMLFDFSQGTFAQSLILLKQEEIVAIENEYQKELSKHRYYKVRRGDNLGKIARKYGISVRRLKQLNNIKGDLIRPGQVLRCS